MARRSKLEILDEARPLVQSVIDELREGRPEHAQAVETVLSLATDSARSAALRTQRAAERAEAAAADKPFALPVDLHLWQWARSEDKFPNVAALAAFVVKGWEEFLAGQWVPEQPTRARRHSQPLKSTLNFSVPEGLLARVEEAADRMVAEKGWPTARGWKLNARQIAVQWLQRTYPDPAPDVEQEEAAAE